MRRERSYILYLEDVQVSMQRILEYVEGLQFDTFSKDYRTIDAVVRNFEIIGEAARHVPDRIKELYPYVPWMEMYYFRNKISHEYFGIDYEILWDIVTSHLQENLKQIEIILEKEAG